MTNIDQDQLQFEEPRYREIYRQYTQFIQELTYPELKHFTFHDNNEISQSVTDLIASKYEISKNWAAHHIYIETEEKNLRKAALDAVNRLKLAKIKKLQDEIVQQIQDQIEHTDITDQLLSDKIKLEMAKAKLAEYFGSVIL
jgi:DNA phosphorothioation-dependent restriction protein DptG